MSALHTDYRPETFEDVVGQAAATRALAAVIKDGHERAFLFYGPSGTGKTTMARITARACGVEDQNVHEIDAATNTGVDDMRNVIALARTRAFGASHDRALLVDECHRLSSAAWDSALKVMEEPPAHLSWLLCTTSFDKVPATIKRRCVKVPLVPVGEADLRKLLVRVMTAEKMRLERDVVDVVVRMAAGSPGQLLMNLATCRGAESRKEASSLLRDAVESDAIVDLCKFILSGGSWPKAVVLLEVLAEEQPESVRIGVCNYLGGALRRAKSDADACRLLTKIDAFAAPFPAGSDRAMLAVAVGRALYAE